MSLKVVFGKGKQRRWPDCEQAHSESVFYHSPGRFLSRVQAKRIQVIRTQVIRTQVKTSARKFSSACQERRSAAALYAMPISGILASGLVKPCRALP